MYKELYGKEVYIINAISERCVNISDITFTGKTEDNLMGFEANNDLYDVPCILKTDGRVLWIEIEKDDWRPLAELDVDAHIPKTEDTVFMDHFELAKVIREQKFSKDELEDYLAVILSQQKLTKTEAELHVNDIKIFFQEQVSVQPS